jgi:hypothetical protein
MSLECSECERDLRGPHDPSCSRYVHHAADCALLRDEERECDCGAEGERPPTEERA